MTPLPTKEPVTIEEMQKLFPELQVIEREDFPPPGAPDPYLIRPNQWAIWSDGSGKQDKLEAGIYCRKVRPSNEVSV